MVVPPASTEQCSSVNPCLEYYTRDHALFTETVRRFIAHEIAPYHAQWGEDGVVPRELFLRAGALDLLCPSLPEAFAGGAASTGCIPRLCLGRNGDRRRQWAGVPGPLRNGPQEFPVSPVAHPK